MTGKRAVALLIFVPAFLLVALAAPRLITGLAFDTVFPVPAGMTANRIYSKENYAKTAQVLTPASLADGETQIVRAEAAWRAGTALPIQTLVEDALTHSPASIQGWTLLSEISQTTDVKKSAAALTMALELSPYDFWLVGRKTRAGAGVWNSLSPDARTMLLSQARLLWGDNKFHAEIRPLLEVKGGPQLMTRAMSGSVDEIRAMNRMVARRRLGLNP